VVVLLKKKQKFSGDATKKIKQGKNILLQISKFVIVVWKFEDHVLGEYSHH